MSENIFQKIEDFTEVEWAKLQNLGEKVAVILKREQKLEPNFIGGAKKLIEDIVALTSEASTAVTDKGLNFEVDSAAYKAFKTLVTDAKAFAPAVEEALNALR